MATPLSDGFGDFGGRAWLNTAHQGALPLAAAEAGREAIGWKVDPHRLAGALFHEVPERVRAGLAGLINARPDDVILGNSASYGLHLIANAYPWAEGDEVMVMAGDFPSDILPWLTLERRFGVRVRRVVPHRHVLTAGEAEAAITPSTRLVCVPWVHSFSGHVTDLGALGDVCRRHGVFLVVNGSQAVGTRPIDVASAPIDALISVGFKWLCGPYGTGFVWVRPRLRDRFTQIKAYWLAQLSEADLARENLEIELDPSTSARDLDIFGTANFNNHVPWAVAIEHIAGIGVERVRAHNDALVGHLVDGLRAIGAQVISPDGGEDRSTLVVFTCPDPVRARAALDGAGVDIAFRGGRLRASPHLYNGTQDIDRLLDALR